MTDRGKAKRIGDTGEAVAKAIIAKSGDWIARDQHIDVGIDLEAEVDEEGAFGAFLKLQVRSTTDASPPKVSGAKTSISVSKTLLRYAMECRLPVVLIRIWLQDESACFVWLQEWIEDHRDSLGLDEAEPATVSVDIPLDNDLRAGLRGRLKEIARGSTLLQFRLSLRDVARWAVVHRSAAAVEKLGELLVAMGHEHDAPVTALIDEMVTFSTVGLQPGQVRATWEYYELIPILVRICRAFGTQFTREQVTRLVVRGELFSRVAMYGLSVLYDTAGDHMKSLELPAAFDLSGHEFLAFYCRLREHYLGTDSLQLAFGSMPLEAPGGAVRRVDDFMNKWANRGDAAFYDYWEPA